MTARVAAVFGQHFPTKLVLPHNPFDVVNSPRAHEAFEHCLKKETRAMGDDLALMYARFLGWSLIETPSEAGRDMISGEILSCDAEDERMDELARLYIDYVVRLFGQQNEGSAPTPSYHQSRGDSEESVEDMVNQMGLAPKSHTHAKKLALLRDDYRCMVTGVFDKATWLALSAADRAALQVPTATTSYCHIFSPSTNWDLQPATVHLKTHYSVWEIVRCFGDIAPLQELSGGLIHRLENGLTMGTEFFDEFKSLRMWFEEAIAPHRYNIRFLIPIPLSHMPQTPVVNFTSTNVALPLPDPRYLKLHAAICRIAHLSGAAEYIEKIDQEFEENANNGVSALMLEARLARLIADT